jgi:hypothetical protein
MRPGLEELQQAIKALCSRGRWDDAWALLEPAMRASPEDPHLLLLANYALERQGRVGAALQVARQSTRLYPQDASGWMNLGRAFEQCYQTDEAVKAYERALKVTRHDEIRAKVHNNLAALWVQVGQFAKAEQAAEQSLALKHSVLAQANLGMAQLARRKWAPGWENYAQNIGRSNRPAWSYGPVWDGTPGQVVAVYGEQGLGDEIAAASCIPDAVQVCKRVVIDCDPRLANLYRRSFPRAAVYAVDQTQVEIDREPEDATQDAGIAAVQLAQHFRRQDSDFPGAAYLTPDPERVTMWRALWATKQRPIIGVAWSGGVIQTGARWRQWSLDQLLPVFRAFPDALWVCLQYRDASKEIAQFRDEHPEIDLVQYPYATLTADYDDTAALVASLDAVFAMQTSVVHLAGALGVPTLAGVAQSGQWRYGETGEEMLWYRSVRLFRQDKHLQWNLRGAATQLQAMLGQAERKAA